jgi:hypothetical protein
MEKGLLFLLVYVVAVFTLPTLVLFLSARQTRSTKSETQRFDYSRAKADALIYLAGFQAPDRNFWSFADSTDGVYRSRVYGFWDLRIEVIRDTLIGQRFVRDTAKHLEAVRQYRALPTTV